MEYQVTEEVVQVTSNTMVTKDLPFKLSYSLKLDSTTYTVKMLFYGITTNQSFEDCFTTVTFTEYYQSCGSLCLDKTEISTKILDPMGSLENNTFVMQKRRTAFPGLQAKIKWFSPKKSGPFIVVPNNHLVSQSVFNLRDSCTAHDFVINIGEDKFYVKKSVLSFYSPFFDRMFNGDFEEGKINETTLEEIVSEEFEVLLKILYPGTTPITEDNVASLWKLADRFDVQCVAKMCEEFTCSLGVDDTNTLKISDRMKLADQYKSSKLMASLIDIMKEMKM